MQLGWTLPLVARSNELFDAINLKQSNVYGTSLRACLIHCNGLYIVIGIRITRNRQSWNGIIIPIHLFGGNLIFGYKIEILL